MKLDLSFFSVEPLLESKAAIVRMNRPERRNAMDGAFFRELPRVIASLEEDETVHSVILCGEGKSFCAGLDLERFVEQNRPIFETDSPENRTRLFERIVEMQQAITAVERSSLIFIAAIHRHCIGGGLDLISACDIRIASDDAVFSLRETALGIVADLGSLQRLPFLIGDGATRLLALTARNIGAEEALAAGLIAERFADQDLLLAGARTFARQIGKHPRRAVVGTKRVLNRAHERQIQEGLERAARENVESFEWEMFRKWLG